MKGKDLKRLFVLVVLVIVVSGCTSARISSQLASGQIGCRSEDITITEETATLITGMHQFIAECKGVKYVCVYQQTAGIKCTELKQSGKGDRK